MGRWENGGHSERKSQPGTNQNRTNMQLCYTKKHTHSKEIVRVKYSIALTHMPGGETKQQLNTMIYGTITIVLCVKIGGYSVSLLIFLKIFPPFLHISRPKTQTGKQVVSHFFFTVIRDVIYNEKQTNWK